MAGIQEADKVRTIFDATIIGVNDYIRSNINKKTTSPTLHDLLQAQATLGGRPHPFQVIKNLFWVNLVGTYGVASAQFYWSSVAHVPPLGGIPVGHGVCG